MTFLSPLFLLGALDPERHFTRQFAFDPLSGGHRSRKVPASSKRSK